MKTVKIALAALSMSLLSACTVIDPGNVGVRVSLGQMEKNVLKPGVQTYNPFTDQITEFDCKQTTVEGKCVPLTADQQPITLDYKVQYRIPESQVTSLFSQYSGDPYAKLVDPQVQEAFRQVVSQYKADHATKNLNTIRAQVVAMVQEHVKGIVQVNDIPITHVDLPEALKEAISQKQVMEQQALQKSYEFEKAQRQAQITVAEAEAQAKSIKMQSQALEQSPALIEYERVKRWDGHLPQTMITPGNSGGFTTLFHVNKPQ